MRSTQRSPGSFTCESAQISFGSAMIHLHASPVDRFSYASSPYSLAAVSAWKPPSRRPPTSRADADRIGGPKVVRSLPGGKRQDRQELSMPPGRALPLQIRQVAARRKLSLPTLEHERPRAITWRRPTYRMVLSMVRSPFYAAAYAFGRRESRTRSEVPVAHHHGNADDAVPPPASGSGGSHGQPAEVERAAE